MSERVVVCVGTRKGLFVAEASRARGRFALRGPFGQGVAVYAALIDRRGAPRLYASSCNPFFGMKVLRSTDLGKTFKETKSAPAFPKDDGRAVANIWSLEAGRDKRDLWCGVEPAALFRSADGGDSWEMVDGLSNHPHSRKWQPGAGGLCLHTILLDGDRVHIGISTGGHYLSEDGGKTYAASNTGVGAGFQPDPYPEFGQCVHKMARHEKAPGRLYMQNHGGWAGWTGPGGPRPDIGVLRSDDYGKTWRSIARGLPSDFGFPIVVHPHDPDTVYVLPLVPRPAPARAVRPRSGAARTAALPGSGSPEASRSGRASSPSSATPWTSTSSSRPPCTSGRRRVSSGWDATGARTGAASSTRCHRSTA